MDHIYRVMPEVAPGVFRSRPSGGSPGYTYRLNEWTPLVCDPRLCKSGYHTYSLAGLVKHVREGDAVVRCERRGIGDSDDQKATNASIMPAEILGYATATALRLTAADSAESVLHIYHEQYPDDLTLDIVIHTVRAFVLGGAARGELAAARAAAEAATRAAKEAAVTAAQHATSWAASWEVARAAEAAARAAVRAASRNTTGIAAASAAIAADSAAQHATSWQDPARAVSWDAARAAAETAAGESLLRHLAES